MSGLAPALAAPTVPLSAFMASRTVELLECLARNSAPVEVSGDDIARVRAAVAAPTDPCEGGEDA